MTDTDIMKNVRCCADHYCKGCSLRPLQGKENCKETLLSFAWNTMYNQKAEIERLHSEVKEKTETITFLKDQAIGWSIDFCNIKNKVKTAKSEAIREFAERLKPKLRKNAHVSPFASNLNDVIIDNLLKEMTEGEK